MSPVPFTDFLLYLRERGLPIGVSAHLTVAKLVAGWDSGNRDALRDALAALLARSPAELRLIQEQFDLYYSSHGQDAPAIAQWRQDPRPPISSSSPAPPTRASVRSRITSWSALGLGVCLLLVVALLLARRHPPTLPQPPDAGSLPVDLGVAPQPAMAAAPLAPATQTARSHGAMAAWSGTAFGLVFVVLYAARRRGRRREEEKRWTAEQLERLPGPQYYRWRLRQLRSPLRREDIEEFCTLLHRLCAEPGAGREPDVDRTVDRLARTGQLTRILHSRRPLRRPIVLLLDYGHDTRVFAAKLDALEQGIARRGIPSVRWYFDGDPSRLSTVPYGPEQGLASVLGQDRDTPILLVTYGSELSEPVAPLPRWVDTLRAFPRCALLHPIADPEAWPLRLQHNFPLSVWPMNRLGLRGAAHALAHDRALRLKIERTRLRVDTVINQESVRGLLRLMALAPRPTIEVVELLRQLYYPEVPEQVLLHIVHAAAAPGAAQLRIPTGQQAGLLTELRRLDQTKEQAARRTLLQALADSQPPLGSVAELRWRLDRSLQALHLRSAHGATADPAAIEAVAELTELAATPICDEVADTLRGLGLPGERAGKRAARVAVDTPLAANAVRRLGQARTPVYGAQAPGSSGWPRPGIREGVVALLAALLVWLAQWGLAGPKTENPPPSLSSSVDLGSDLASLDQHPADLRTVEPPSDLRPADLRTPVDLLPGASQPISATVPRITIDTVPPGASVFLDDLWLGQSGPNFTLRIPKGSHKLRLELSGRKTLETIVNITATQKLTYALEPAPSRLDIKTPATNAGARGGEVFIDGAPAGVVPVLVDLPPGRHLIEIRKQGYNPYTETVDVKVGETQAVWVVLQTGGSSLGSLLVAADVMADVLVDGQPRGKAPVVVYDLSEGEHQVDVRRTEPGAPRWFQTVRVKNNEQTKVFAQTTPPPPAQGSLMVTCNIPDVEVEIDAALKPGAGKPLNLPPGQHTVSVSARGYKTIVRVVNIVAGKQHIEHIYLEAENTKLPARLDVQAQASTSKKTYDGGDILVDNVFAGKVPLLVDVPSGPHRLEIRKEGLNSYWQNLNLTPGQTQRVVLPPPSDDPDANSGPSAKRGGAILTSLGKAYVDSVSWPMQKRTRWFRINIEKRLVQDILECGLRIENAGTDLNVDIFNSLGTQIGFSPGPAPNHFKKLAVQIDDLGAYFIRIQATQPKDESVFTIICS
jgi:uncharacterized protein with von Willebrand factor type A (vWA) domain